MRGAVLAYHAQNCAGSEYATNDHIALNRDLHAIKQHDIALVSLHAITRALAAGRLESLPRPFVALSCDDGTLLDWHDYEHPQFGLQRSFANILRDHFPSWQRADGPLLTAFVIASADARAAIDAGCYGGAPLSKDDWWREAADEGLLAIENHSWDHLHPVLPEAQLAGCAPGDFYSVNKYSSADRQVRQARETIKRVLGNGTHRCELFAYPYGQASDYMRREYFVHYAQEHGTKGAFTTVQELVTADTDIFAIPRLVHGDAWQTPEEFNDLLRTLTDD